MHPLIQSFLNKTGLGRAWSVLKERTAPVRAAWTRYTAPISGAWQQATAPFNRRWVAFAHRYPRIAWTTAWAARLVRWGIYLLLALIVGVGLGLFGHMPGTEELRNIETANATEIYSSDSVLIGKFYIENRTAISLDKISPNVINALIATEDRRFFEHRGIDLWSWVRVAFGMVAGRESAGGGSTLSQQLAKNLYPRQKYWVPGMGLVVNKVRENYISVKLERIYSKEELLSLYLNTVPFGGDIFGISVASRHYFGKKARDLSADQAAMLIGMLKATTYYNPLRNPENAKKRRNVVLQQMVRNGHLTSQQYDELKQKPVGAKRFTRDGNNDGMGTYFREYLRTEVMPTLLKQFPKSDGSGYNLYTDGLKIYTTLHSKMQQYAEEAVQKHMQELQKQFDQHWKNYKKDKPWGDDKWIDEAVKRSDRWSTLKESGLSDEEALANFEQPARMTVFSWKNGGSEVDTTLKPIDSLRYYFCLLNCGFMAMDPHNGYVRAWVGGTNFKYFKYDHNLSRRQVGSTFKPIVYAAAVKDSIKPCQYFSNTLIKLGDWEPHNSDETYGGWYSMVGGLTNSVNVVAARLIEKVGIQATIDMARQMGVTSTLPREFGISLGAADISLYDMMKVYGTLANQGKRPEPVTVLRVLRRDGEVLYDYKETLAKDPSLGPHVQALSPNHAATMTRMMQAVIDYGTGSRLRRGFGIHGDFAGKTGTTQNQSDGWFICYNPELVTGAWVGAESPAVRFRSMSLGQGSAMALPIVAWFWHKVANDRKLGRLLQEEFPDLKPEVSSQFGCPSWIDIPPDSLYLLQEADSLMRDSVHASAFRRFKTGLAELFGKEPDAQDEPSEAPISAEEKAQRDVDKEKRREDRKEKRREFFDKLLNRNRPNQDPQSGGEEGG